MYSYICGITLLSLHSHS